MLKKMFEKAEELGFDVYEGRNKKSVDIHQYTPAGEDWWEYFEFDGTAEGFAEDVRQRWRNFDIDEEVEVWIPMRGQNGVPRSITVLLKDAEWKQEALLELKEALEAILEEED